MPEPQSPLVVGIGGTTLPGSSTERALSIALESAESAGMRTRLFGGEALGRLPLYVPHLHDRTPQEHDFVAAIRSCSGVILASPGYHGSISGLVKNAIDLIEETAKDVRPYLNDVPVGILATAYGWQAAGTTVTALRTIVHALRGWPTPFAAAINVATTKFDAEGGCADAAVHEQLLRVGSQVARGVRMLAKSTEIQ